MSVRQTTSTPSKSQVESIQNRLRKLASLDDLKELFWSELGYDHVNKPMSRVPMGESGKALAEDPVLFAATADQSAFHVIYMRMNSNGLRRTDERNAIEKLIKNHPYALYVVSDSDYSHWHFINVKLVNRKSQEAEENQTPARRKVFRRISISPDSRIENRLRTASERLARLQIIEDGFLAQSPLTIQVQHDDAFDVEEVQKSFFREFKTIYDAVVEEIGKKKRSKADPKHEALLLLNRLLFLYFVQKKCWLNNDAGFLIKAFNKTYRGKKGLNDNFYSDFIVPLFDRLAMPDCLDPRFKNVPFLNGGLFEISTTATSDISIPNATFAHIFDDLLEKYNFTVTEDTPLDIEVAIDPEMLGKIFEELITGRHESGAYYTPRPIVSFMCREALKGFLGGYETLVDYHDANSVSVPEAKKLLAKLADVKVVDPACGSGAYLVGMLHELDHITSLLDTRATPQSARDVYQRKLSIIQRNIYGVDLDEVAVEIARLRLWLSLIVDFEGKDVPPLPNLDLKIGQGDSLLGDAPAMGGTQQDAFTFQLSDQIATLKARHTRENVYGDKQSLLQKIVQLKAELRELLGREKSDGFDWTIEFSEVFFRERRPGFDIVVANPPYVRQELIKDIKPALKAVFTDTFCGTADLYCYFYIRAIELLTPGGMLAFISPNKWFRAKYGECLREYVARYTQVQSITDFGELPVFKTAATFPMVFTARKKVEAKGYRGSEEDTSNRIKTVFTQVTSLEAPYPDVRRLIDEQGADLPDDALDGKNWTLTDATTARMLRQMESAGIPLEQYVNGQIYYGIKTGYNKAFVIDGAKQQELIAADPKSAEIIKPLAVGDDIRKWQVNRKDKWLIVTEIGVDIKRYPAVYAHLKKFRTELEDRWDKGNHWWELRPCDYYHAFEKPKILYPVIGKSSRFAYDDKGVFTNDKGFLIPTGDLYLLAILNSTSMWNYLKAKCSVLGDAEKGGRLELRAVYMQNIPIPQPKDAVKKRLVELVSACLKTSKKGEDCSKLEAQLNKLVATLYGIPASLELATT